MAAVHGGALRACAHADLVARPRHACGACCGAREAPARGMRTVRRLLYRDIIWSVVFVAVAFLSLFYFIDFVDELEGIGRNNYTAVHAAASAALELPGHFYELAPICVLIGTIYSMARLAQSSEYTILRTGGLGPVRALSLLAALGLFFGAITFLVGDYLAPLSRARGGAAEGVVSRRPAARPRRRVAEGTPQRRRRRAAISVNVQRTASERRTAGHSHLRARHRRPPAHAHRSTDRARRRRVGVAAARRGAHRLADARAGGARRRGRRAASGARCSGRARCRRPWWPPRCCR